MSEKAEVSGPGDIPLSDRDLGLVPGSCARRLTWWHGSRPPSISSCLPDSSIIALLLLLMGILSIVVIGRMNQQVDQLVALETQTDLARQAIYSVTAQSH